MDGIRKGLSQLRDSFPPQDAQQQVIDALEHNISEMMAQLMDRPSSPSGKRTGRRHVRALVSVLSEIGHFYDRSVSQRFQDVSLIRTFSVS